MNERFQQGSYMRVFTVFTATILVSIIMNEVIPAFMFIKMEGACFTVCSGAGLLLNAVL